MSCVDFEMAWVALQAEIASKTQHGREGLLTRMAELAAEHRVAGELPRLLRLYGVEVARGAAQSRDDRHGFAAGVASVEDVAVPGHDGRMEDHYGNEGSRGRAAAFSNGHAA